MFFSNVFGAFGGWGQFMRAKISVIAIIFFLLSTYISVEANRGDPILENDSSLICPKKRCSQPSRPENKNINRFLENTPIAFTENLGQIKNDNVRFYVYEIGL